MFTSSIAAFVCQDSPNRGKNKWQKANCLSFQYQGLIMGAGIGVNSLEVFQNGERNRQFANYESRGLR
ncbi:hypothetical protein BLOT_001867 [Blomia tropicalis]|nr:hypothetical protein BLOT_001867 [Blomia tropicalis]